jgi:hypothetical protein
MRTLFATLLLLMAAPSFAATLCTATGTGVKTAIPIQASSGNRAPTVTIVGTETVSSGSGTGAVTVIASLDNVTYVTVGTLSITDTAPDGIQINTFGYSWLACNVTGITGTGAALTVKEQAR